ncbi:GHKL domain-containing protein [Lysinibacillus sp. OL1_EC]|uniref:sensor histidine kinase n=1 Tax=Lysinibacillus sp. OL1_EC TaxID=2943493 RepID=UPI002030DFC2|nr:GHKL domain-containing protein [Lysinibacillus sp. OL1_EC]
MFFCTSFIALLLNSSFFKICLDFTEIIFIGMVSDHLAQIISGTSAINNDYLQLLIFICFYLILFYLLQFFVHKFYTNNQYTSLATISKVFLSLLSCITIIVLYLNIFVPSTFEEQQLTKINLIIQLSYLIIIFVVSMFLIKNNKEKSRLKYQKIKHSQFNDYMKSLEKVNSDMQMFRHDYLNILTTISSYIANEDMEQLKNYFNHKIIKVEKETFKKNLMMKDFSNLEIIELKGLLTTKLILSTEKDINVQIEIPDKIKDISMDIIDFSRILGILIDNAIEASEKSNEPEINIVFLQTPNSCIFVLENSFNGEVDNSKIFQEGFSTKGGNRGYGLKNVLDIKKGYPNLFLNTRLENNRFIQELELTNRK